MYPTIFTLCIVIAVINRIESYLVACHLANGLLEMKDGEEAQTNTVITVREDAFEEKTVIESLSRLVQTSSDS